MGCYGENGGSRTSTSWPKTNPARPADLPVSFSAVLIGSLFGENWVSSFQTEIKPCQDSMGKPRLVENQNGEKSDQLA